MKHSQKSWALEAVNGTCYRGHATMVVRRKNSNLIVLDIAVPYRDDRQEPPPTPPRETLAMIRFTRQFRHIIRPEIPTSRFAALCELILGQDVLMRADALWHTGELDFHQSRGLGDMQETIVPLGHPRSPGLGLFHELAPPALPADGFTAPVFSRTWPPIRGRQRHHAQGAHHMHPHRPLGFLGAWPRFHGGLASLM
jgi:hypothetical protein